MNIRKVSWNEFEAIVAILAHKIRGEYDFICGIPRGGLIPAVMLSHILSIKMIGFEFFSNQQKILLVDDIADSGKTLAPYVNSPNVAIATVFAKPSSKVEPDFYGEMTTEWIQFPYEVGTDDELSTVNFKDKNASE